MFKYQVKFETRRQIDGWTSHLDLEYDTVKETITVSARNKAHAVKVACKEAYGWMTYAWPTHVDWNEDDVKSIKRR